MWFTNHTGFGGLFTTRKDKKWHYNFKRLADIMAQEVFVKVLKSPVSAYVCACVCVFTCIQRFVIEGKDQSAG